MYFSDFCKAIKTALDQQSKIVPTVRQVQANQGLITALEQLISSNVEESLKMTWATILFEGFYRHLSEQCLKNALVDIRTKRWEQHFGTPTVPFLLSYKHQIDETKLFFSTFEKSTQLALELSPWFVRLEGDFTVDEDNKVIADSTSISRVVAPERRETMGLFTKTHNPFGGFTTAPSDPISKQFIEQAEEVAAKGGKVLEIGAAFGAATLEALAKGATVFCNDIDPENLAVVRKRFMEMTSDQGEPITGDSSQLVLVPGELPNDLISLPKQSFDAILICRVLHFFTGVKIEESLALLSRLLVPGGKIYIVCETPFLKNWQRFIPEFQSRLTRGEEWPGEITTPSDYESSGRVASLPKFVHWITKEILERCLSRAGLHIKHAAYINRAGQFPDDLLLPEYGQESIGAIGIK